MAKINKRLIDECREKAVEIVKKCVCDRGFIAAIEVYPDNPVCTRDNIITSFGGCLVQGNDIKQAIRGMFETIRDNQSELGQMPACVFVDNKDVWYGCEDSNLWYLIGLYNYIQISGDIALLKSSIGSIERCIFWLRCQDRDECGLLEAREGGNWMDVFVQNYNVLLDNVMWYWALKCASKMFALCGMDGTKYLKLSEQIKKNINLMFWIDHDHPLRIDEFKSFGDGGRKLWRYYRNIAEIGGRAFYLPFLSFMDAADYFDSMGNIMAVMFGITDGEESFGEKKSELILNYIRDVGVNRPFPVKSIYPPVGPGDKWWRETLRLGMAYREKSDMPYQYQNGAIWPFIGGFYVASLVKAGRHEEAEAELEHLAMANKLGYAGEWRFNEFLHGLTGKPMGGDDQLWSAGMYIYAYEAVKSGKVSGLE